MSVVALVVTDPWGWDQFGPLHWALLSVVSFATIARTLASASTSRIEPRLWVGWGVLLGSLTLSAALSGDRWHAVVGTPDRHLGLVTWLLFFGLFVSSMLWFGGGRVQGDDRDVDERAEVSDPTMLMVATAVGLVVVAGYGFLELAGVSAFASEFAGGRIGSTFGQPAYLGAAAVLAVPLAAALAIDHSLALWQRTLGGVASMGGLVMLAASQSRGAWVGFVAALVMLLLVNRQRVTELDGPTRNRMVVAIGAMLVGVLAVPALRSRAWSLTDLDGVIAGRSDEWAVGLRTLSSGGKAGGFIGLGPETYRTRFGEFVDADYVIDYGREVFTDRAHSGLIDAALAAGWIGLLGYLVVLAVVVGSCLRLARSRAVLDVGVAVAVVAYLVQQLFLFPLAELDPLFWVFAGLAVARASDAADPNPWALTVPKLALDAGAIGAGALAFVALVAGGLDVMADRQIAKAVDESSNTVALDLADSARGLRPDSTRYDFIAARIAQRELPDGLERALVRLSDGLAISPDDPALLVEQATIQLALVRFPGSTGSLDVALDSLEHLESIDPNNPWMQEKYGIALSFAGEFDAAIIRLQRAVVLLPKNAEVRVNLAEAQEQAGQRAAACDSLRAAEKIAPADTTIRARLSEKNC